MFINLFKLTLLKRDYCIVKKLINYRKFLIISFIKDEKKKEKYSQKNL